MTIKRVHSLSGDRAAGLSPVAARLLVEAGKAFQLNKPNTAEHSLNRLLALAPNCAEANRLMGIRYMMRGTPAKAAEYLRRAQAACPQDATIHMNLGGALFENGEVEPGLSMLRHACELAPDMAACWYNLGRALKIQAHTKHANIALQRALDLDPTHITARLNLANTQTSLGDINTAVTNYRDILRRQPNHPKAWFELANLKIVSFTKRDLSHLQSSFNKLESTVNDRVWIGFALAKALEDNQHFADAFDTLEQVNALKRSHVSWCAEGQHDRVTSIMEAFTRPLSEAPLGLRLGHEVIFIVSLPRSGSTLTEQILASHSNVEGANEITDLPQIIDDESKRRGEPFPQWVSSATTEDWARLGRDYLARTERWRKKRPRFTDKNLVTWELVGAALTMLPGARIVNSRRDPLETCFACYRQLFSNGAHFSYNLDDMASYYADYNRLSNYWKDLFPNRFFDHVYESLLADPEGQIRQLLNFCDLNFEPSCLEFHRTTRSVISTASAGQVRQPLRADTARQARYGDKLNRLRANLISSGLI